MDSILNTVMPGVLRFSTEKYSYLYSSTERVVYRISPYQNMCPLPSLAIDVRPFDVPSLDTLESILSTQLSQLVLTLTEQCNLRCKYCIYGDSYKEIRGYSEKFMNKEIALKAVEYFLQRSKESVFISFYGGEPTLRFYEMLWLIDEIRHNHPEKEIKFSVATNGTLLYKERVNELVRRGVYLQLSLDGPRSIHDFNRVTVKQEGTFDRIYRLLVKLYDEYPDYYREQVMFEVTLTPLTDLYKVYDFFLDPLFEDNLLKVGFLDPNKNDYIEKYGDEVAISKFKEALRGLHKRFVEGLMAECKTDKFLWELFGRRLKDIHLHLGSDIGEKIPLNGVCIPGIKKLYVDVEGNFCPCEKVYDRLIIGTVEKGIDIKRVYTLLKGFEEISLSCRSCFAKDLCRICFSRVTSASGDLNAEYKEAECSKEKREVEEAFILYAELMEVNSEALKFLESYEFE